MNPNAAMIRRDFRAGVILLLSIVLLLAGCGSGDDSAAAAQRAAPPVSVAVQTIDPGTVDVYASYPGRISGAREVEVRARVEGVLLQRHYNEGAFVQKGQLLLTIDPRSLEAVVKQREAQVAQAKAQLSQAQQAWQRVSKLYKVNATSEAERDKARAALHTAQASVELAQANLETAQISLDYTTVEAPLSGVTSLQEIDEGALVTHGTLLTTITQLDPVNVLFSVPAEDALMREKALAAMGQEDGATRKATLVLPTGKTYPQSGVVDFTQSTIDPNTGTVRLRAVFDNGKHHLVPGRFVRIRIRLETRKNAIVVPEKAIGDNQQSSIVYVVTDENKVAAVPVQLGPVVENGRIIEKGLSPGDKVITVGLGSARPGSSVKIVPASKLALGQSGGAAKPGETEAKAPAQADSEKPAQAGEQAN